MCIHTPYTPIGVIAALAASLSRVPFVLFYHGGRRLSMRANLRSHLFAALPRLGSNMNIVVSEAGKYLLGRRTKVLPPPIDTAQSRSRENNVIPFLSSRDTVLYPARFVPTKGQIDLVEAERYLQEKKEFADHQLLFVGHQQDATYCDATAKRITDYGLKDRIDIWDYVDSEMMDSLYTQAKLITFPTYEEGFGRITVEAGLRGIPTVAYRVGGVEEVIVDGISGILVEKGGVEGLADGIHAPLTNESLRCELGENARMLYSARYRTGVIAKKFWKLVAPLALRNEHLPGMLGKSTTVSEDRVCHAREF